ncbi:MAG: AAA family ATPase [Clostridiales bacterium]|nr:AAA family ATPase [Clostridiales bacterium]
MFNDKYIKSVSLKSQPPNNSYLSKLPIVNYLYENELVFEKEVTFLVGENGTGKSTLLEAIAIAFGFNAEGGTKNFNFSTNNTHSNLSEYIKLSKTAFAKDGFFLRAESLYNVATFIEELDSTASSAPKISESYGGASLHHQSHGESFLSLVQNRFGGNGLYILDEPESALSPQRQMVLIAEINRLIKNNSQFIIATHSPILMTFPNAQIFQLSETGIDLVKFEDTEHFQLTKRFLNYPQQMLKYLLE